VHKAKIPEFHPFKGKRVKVVTVAGGQKKNTPFIHWPAKNKRGGGGRDQPISKIKHCWEGVIGNPLQAVPIMQENTQKAAGPG